MKSHKEILASLSEGVCPICDTRLDDNRVCASGVEWDIKKGSELCRVGQRRYEDPDHVKAPFRGDITRSDPKLKLMYRTTNSTNSLIGQEITIKLPTESGELATSTFPASKDKPVDMSGPAYIIERMRGMYGGYL